MNSIKPGEIQSLFYEKEDIHLKIDIDNVKNEKYSVKTYRLNSLYGSVLDEWMRLECSPDVETDEINYLKRICQPRLSFETKFARSNKLSFDMNLEANEVILLNIIPC